MSDHEAAIWVAGGFLLLIFGSMMASFIVFAIEHVAEWDETDDCDKLATTRPSTHGTAWDDWFV